MCVCYSPCAVRPHTAGRCIVFSWSSLFVGAVFYAVAPNIQGLQ